MLIKKKYARPVLFNYFIESYEDCQLYGTLKALDLNTKMKIFCAFECVISI